MSIRERLANSKKFYRLMEMVPGTLSWTVILAPIVFSAIFPRAIAYFILVYTSYWVLQSISFVVNALRGFFVMEKWVKIDWLGKLKKEFKDEWGNYYYATILPFANETERVLVPTIDSFAKCNYPKERKILILSSEGKLPEGKKVSKQMEKKYRAHFDKIVVTEHHLKEGEIVGKSSNENWGGRVLDKKCKEWGIDPAHVVVCSNDADMSIHKHYMAACIYWILKQGKDKHVAVIQPVTADHRNIWDTVSIVRIRVVASTLWHAAVPFISHRFYIFSHYAMTLKMLKGMNFWDPDIIQEDIRTFSKSLFTYGTRFRVVPVFLPVEGEPVIGEGLWDTLQLQFKQVRRWAWGACEFAYIIRDGLLKKNNVPKWRVILYALDYVIMHVDWVIISYVPLFGTAILFLINPSFSSDVVGRNLPIILRYLLTFASLFLVFFVILELKMVVRPPKTGSLLARFWRIAKWVISPYTGVFLSSLPAFDAQTRLLLNKRLKYVVYRKD